MKASDFAIGLRDFFTILIPGCVLLLLLGQPSFKGQNIQPIGDGLFGFTVASYLIGSIAAAFGSILDGIVDSALESRSLSSFVRWLGSLFPRFPASRPLAERVEVAAALRAKMLRANPDDQDLLGGEKLKSFWWDLLRLNSPAAIAELDRLEANQKLFRSLVGTFLLLIMFVTAARYADAGKGLESLDRQWLAIAALGSFLFYAGGRLRFLQTLYRFAVAHSIRCT